MASIERERERKRECARVRRKTVQRTALALSLLGVAAFAPDHAAAHGNLRLTTDFDDRSFLQSTLDNLVANHIDIDDLCVGPAGEWMIVADDVIYRSSTAPSAMVSRVQQYIDSGRTIDAIAMGPNGSWVVAADDWFYRGPNVPLGDELLDVVKGRQNAGRQIDEIVFTPSGGFVVLSEGYYYGRAVPAELWDAIRDTDSSGRRPRRISIGSDGRWVLLGEQWFASNGLSSGQRSNLEGWQRSATSLDHVLLGMNDSYVWFSHTGATLRPSAPMANLEYRLIDQNGATKNIWQRLNELGVPGVSLAVIQGNSVRWARGYGTLEAGGDRWVRTSSPYSVASMSKYVAGLTAMRKVFDGTISLAQDARTMANNGDPIMANWQSRGATQYGSSFPSGVTLRRLLSHSASMNNNETDDGWGGMIPVSRGERSTLEILLGYGCDGSSCALNTKRAWYDSDLGAPGTVTDYSNSGYEVVRGMLEDRTAGSDEFETIAQAEVFDELGMTDSTFEQPLPSSFASRAAPPLNGSGAAITRESYQWIAGGGLYTTPKDYARAMLVLVDTATTHSSNFLSATQTSAMLTEGRTGSRYGFGVQLSQAQVGENGGWFAHGGYIPNYSWARMVGIPNANAGIAIVTNFTGTNGRRLVCEIENAFRIQFSLPALSC